MDTGGYEHRFGGIQRLYGKEPAERIRLAHVCVIGIGGVGSWAAEALARSGVGELTLVDWDDICFTNTNRQIHAMTGTAGRAKVEVMAERIALINPDCTVHVRREFFRETTAEAILDKGYDFVLDAIDKATEKCMLINMCRERKTPILTVGGAGGRTDAGTVQVADLNRAFNDKLLALVRKTLRQQYGFTRSTKRKFKVDCVFSPQDVVYPQPDGTTDRIRTDETKLRLDCHSGYGTATHVTGTFGFAAADRIVERLAEG
jgi:tRNA A37 threonylcarbamoyladenosine dehydratase